MENTERQKKTGDFVDLNLSHRIRVFPLKKEKVTKRLLNMERQDCLIGRILKAKK